MNIRKKHTLKTKDDLIQVKGIGDVIADNILKDVLNDKKKKKSKKSDKGTKKSKETKELRKTKKEA